MTALNPVVVMALDVGHKRIGVAWADTAVRVPIAYTTVSVEGDVVQTIEQLIAELKASIIVIGLPRNQSGDTTTQSEKVRVFAAKLQRHHLRIAFQDESLTSVLAEDHLRVLGKPYTKADIDAYAATIILADYLELHHGA